MLIDICAFINELNEQADEIIIRDKLDLSDFSSYEGKDCFKTPADVELSLRQRLQNVFLTLRVKVLFYHSCDRCLKDIVLPLEFDFESQVSPLGNNRYSVDMASIDSFGRLDLKDLTVNLLIGNIPMKALCGQDCKGLCMSCGADLNVYKCGCQKDG